MQFLKTNQSLKNICLYYHQITYTCIYVFCKFRCSSHRLPVQTGRWYTMSRNNMLCHFCGSNNIGDEFHYVMTCSFFNNEGQKYLSCYCQTNANILKFNYFKLIILLYQKIQCTFIKVITMKISPLGYKFCFCPYTL